MEALVSWTRDVFTGIGGVALLGVLAFLFLWHRDPKNVELMLSQVLRLLAFLGTSAKKWQIKFAIQGKVSRHIRDLEKDTGAYAPHDLSIQWVPDGTERSSFLQGETVVARMSYDDNPHSNYLTAVLLYMRQGLIPQGRQFLPAPIRRAMDLATINLILERVGDRSAQNVFAEEFLPGELESDDDVRVPYNFFVDMEDFGLFSKLFLPEVLEYGIREREGGPRSRHREELSSFVRWLKDLASDTEYRTRAQLAFLDRSLMVQVVPVGIWEKIVAEGTQPYVEAVAYCRDRGVRTVYLVARGQSRKIISEICYRVQKMGLCNVEGTFHFRSRLPGTADRIEATICRLSVIK